MTGLAIVRASMRCPIAIAPKKKKIPNKRELHQFPNTNLNALISIRHHGYQEINENNHRHQQIDAKDKFKQNLGPLRPQMSHWINVNRGRLAKHSKEQTLKGQKWSHRSCMQNAFRGACIGMEVGTWRTWRRGVGGGGGGISKNCLIISIQICFEEQKHHSVLYHQLCFIYFFFFIEFFLFFCALLNVWKASKAVIIIITIFFCLLLLYIDIINKI